MKMGYLEGQSGGVDDPLSTGAGWSRHLVPKPAGANLSLGHLVSGGDAQRQTWVESGLSIYGRGLRKAARM